MAKSKNKSLKDLNALSERLEKGKLTKTDLSFINELIGHAIELRKAIDASKIKSGGKTVISKLPFGVDIVK